MQLRSQHSTSSASLKIDNKMASRKRRSDVLAFNGRSLRSCRAHKTKVTSTSVRKSKRRRLLDYSYASDDPDYDCDISPPVITPIKEPSEQSVKSRKVNKSKARLPSDQCNFCNHTTKADYELGELKQCEDITAHMYCLYFAPGLLQNGQIDEGINGFLLEDIRKELRRGKLLKCSYCPKRGAVVGCTVAQCSANFHLPCGIANGAFIHFHEDRHYFPSYCKKHRPKISVPQFKGKVLCTICQENVKNADRSKLLYLKCCQTYFHQECLNKLAYHQGEFHLKCPNCKNDKEFVITLKNSGIHVPCRDASWELTGELNWTEVVFECSASVCNCSNGRNHNGDNEWELFACDRCGSSAVHVACAGLSEATEWVCEICSNVR